MSDAWKSAGVAALWLPTLAAAEVKYSIPTDLLARMAFQESSFRAGVISGAIPSSAGALGIMQLMPVFFASVRVPVPFTGADTVAQVDESAAFLKSLHDRFGDWQEAVAAYNWGAGNEHHEYIEHGSYILADMPNQTQNYVREVFADVPLPGALLT
jgi:soluble lytic murein transglycosylase-like protein